MNIWAKLGITRLITSCRVCVIKNVSDSGLLKLQRTFFLVITEVRRYFLIIYARALEDITHPYSFYFIFSGFLGFVDFLYL